MFSTVGHASLLRLQKMFSTVDRVVVVVVDFVVVVVVVLIVVVE